MRGMDEDPIIAAIRSFERAWAAYLETTDHDAVEAAGEAWHRAAWHLVEIEPTTLDGVLALLHVAQLRWPTDGEPVFEGITRPNDPDSNRNWTQEALALIEKALIKLSQDR
jgi:hypothetical protein